ncbi:hypothetical protein CSV63_11220 [Sporosarcina sp. P34]|nr:hypothetical protein CSV63_11220 [Sporosarcina sp. P34]
MKPTPHSHYTLFPPQQYSGNYELLKIFLQSSRKKGILKKEWKFGRSGWHVRWREQCTFLVLYNRICSRHIACPDYGMANEMKTEFQ